MSETIDEFAARMWTKFWSIVDRHGPSGLPSDEWGALSQLVDRDHHAQAKLASTLEALEAMRAENARWSGLAKASGRSSGARHITFEFRSETECTAAYAALCGLAGASTPTAPADRHLTPAEQDVMHTALRKSTRKPWPHPEGDA